MSASSATGQVDIQTTLPFDSIRLHHLGSYLQGGTVYEFYFASDSLILINQPFNDTVYCQGDSIHVPYTVTQKLGTANVFSLQLSNASGSFSSPTVIGSLIFDSSSVIHGRIPITATGAPGYRIRIVSSTGIQSADNGKSLTIKTTPVPVASGNSPLCEGSTLNLTANAASGSNYSWSGPSSFNSSQQNNTIVNATLSQSGGYIVSASLNGCSAKDTVTVLVKPIPATPTAGNNGPVCSGQDLDLTATSATSGVSYTWAGPVSFSSANQNPTRSNSTTAMSGIYSVTATLNGCTSPAGTTNAVVNQTPATPTAGNNSPVCAGASINLTASSATSGVSYSWTGPGGFNDNNQNPSISPATTGNAGVYSVTATLNGCTSPAGTTTVSVNNVSSIGAYPSPNDTICENNKSGTLVAVPNNAGSSPQYQWYKNGNLISGANSVSYPANGIADGDTFQCRMIATGICSSPLTLFSNKIGMTVLPNTGAPTVSISASPGLLLSPWQLVTFTAIPGGNAGPEPKYQWKRNGQNVAGATADKWSANNLSDKDTISCIITSGVWCALPGSVESNKLGVNIKLGIDDVEGDNGLVLYPNPNDGRFSLLLTSSQGGGTYSVEVVNVVGQVVYSHDIPLTPFKGGIKVSLPETVVSGVYLLRVKSGDGVKTLRFTVQR